MSKYVIKEGVISKFLVSIFDAVARGKTDRALRALQHDPELQKVIKELDRLKREIEKKVASEKAQDPVFKRAYDTFDKTLKR